jgi:hypothetical protein
VSGEIEPAALARLIEFSERPRQEDWSLRSALCRYAQPEPQRVSDVLTVVRRIEFALQGALTKQVEKDGPAVWAAFESSDGTNDDELLGLLRAMADLDALGDRLAAWAVDRSGGRINDEIDATVAEVTQRLDDLGVAQEPERTGPPSRSRG